MTSSTADLLQALRALDLPAPRVAYLSGLILSAPTAEERHRIITEATTESRRNAYRVAADLAKWDERNRGYEERAQNAPQTPSAPRTGTRRYAEQHPEPRPVSVSYTKPTKQAPEPVDESKPVCPPEHPHSDHCYTAHRCRCSQCRAAKAKTQREHRERKYGAAKVDTAPEVIAKEVHVCPPDHKHGQTYTCYNRHRCRCVECKAKQKNKMALYNSRTNPR